MVEKLWFIIPELILFAGVVAVAVMGLSHRRAVRDALPAVSCLVLAIAFVVTPMIWANGDAGNAGFLLPELGKYVKMVACLIGILLTLTSVGLIDRRMEGDVEKGRIGFDPLRAGRGEFHTFMLLSIMGVMLCCNATDLIWLFLALELTSLPTYIMIAISRPNKVAQEAAMKYFFLGAMSAATFLYGFALLYGSTGTINLVEMRTAFGEQIAETGQINLVGLIGMMLALLGLAYKIAAAPMHFYAADVYEGAASPVTAFLGFIPKTAGMLAFMLLLYTIGWHGDGNALPQPIMTMLFMVAVLTMTLGNIGALLQKSAKRMLAYSSIAHSGYMLIGVIAGPGFGFNAVLLYLFIYGIMNTGAFAVLAGLERQGQEVDSVEDLAGLRHRHPAMAWALALCAGSLLGFPPLFGFIGKLALFIAGVEAGQIALVVIAGLNSAISAWYYLRLVGLPVLAGPSARSETIVRHPSPWARATAILAAIAVVVLPIFGSSILERTAGLTGDVRQITPPPADSPNASEDVAAVIEPSDPPTP